MVYQAVIFDLDGTLIDSLEDLAESVNDMLSGRGLPTHETREYRYFVGDGPKKLIERALPKEKARDASFLSAALAEFKEIYAKNGCKHTKVYDGIPELLSGLKEKNIPLGVCTNKHQSAATELVERFFGASTFLSVIGDREGFLPKPDPQKALAVAGELHVLPEKVLYLGDSGVDMETAKNAGFFPAGVLWGFRGKEELISHGAKLLLRTPLEFFGKVDALP